MYELWHICSCDYLHISVSTLRMYIPTDVTYVQWYCESYSVTCTLKFLFISVNCMVTPHFLQSLCLYPQLFSSKSILNPTRIVVNINTFRSFQFWVFVLLSGYNKNYHISTVNYYAILEMKWLDGICAKVGRSDCWKSKVRSKFLNVTFLKSSLPPSSFLPSHPSHFAPQQ